MSKTKVLRHYMKKTISDMSSSFYIEVRGKSKLLCYEEHDHTIAELELSKKSYHTLMRFTSGVSCQRWLDSDIGDEVTEALDDMVSQCNISRGGRRMHTSFREPPVKKELNPFVIQIFDPQIREIR